jgi:capsular polysaccharide transport system permease protein
MVVAFVFHTAGLYELPENFGLFYLGWLFAILYPAGLGLIVGCLTEMYEWVEKLVGPMSYFALPISGAFFMADWLPDDVRKLALLVPSVNSYELIRSGQFGPGVRVHYDLPYEVFACASLILIGLALSRSIHKHLVIE